jgi:hypothetical protein
MGYDVGERGLPARRTVKQAVVKGLSPSPGRLDEDSQVILQRRLPHILLETLGTDTGLDLTLLVSPVPSRQDLLS